MKKTLEEVQRARSQIEEKRKETAYVTEAFQIKTLIHDYRSDKLEIPEWQRAYVWGDKIVTKSRLIESILLGLPIPVMFFAESESPDGESSIYEIIDGAQRTQTLERFCDPNEGFELEGLETLTALNGFRYNDLPPRYRTKFDDTFMRVIILDEETTEASKQELFSRINSHGIKVETGEQLWAAYPEKVRALIRRCIEDTSFNQVAPSTKKQKERREPESLILRFFALKNNFPNYDGELDAFLKNYLSLLGSEFDNAKTTEASQAVEEKYFKQFSDMITFVEHNFSIGFRKKATHRTTPKVRYEAISLGVSQALEEVSELKPDKEDIKAWLDSPEFATETITHSANSKSRVVSRRDFVRNQLLQGQLHG